MRKPHRPGTFVLVRAARIVVLSSILHVTSVNLVAQPPQLKSVEIKPTSVEGGQPIEVIIRLTKKGNMWVKLNSSNNSVIPVQANMPVHLNNVSSTSIYLDTNVISGSSQFVTISVSQGALQRTASVSVTPQGALTGGGGGAYSIYKIKNSELALLYKHAQSKGWTFSPRTEFGGPLSLCTINEDAQGIRLVANHPEACFFEFFGGNKLLAAGWTLDKLAWSTTVAFRKKLQYIDKPKFGTNDLYFKVHFNPKTASAVLVPTDIEHLHEIWLKGPQGQQWQDAFQ
jgi:hypothetical protein